MIGTSLCFICFVQFQNSPLNCAFCDEICLITNREGPVSNCETRSCSKKFFGSIQTMDPALAVLVSCRCGSEGSPLQGKQTWTGFLTWFAIERTALDFFPRYTLMCSLLKYHISIYASPWFFLYSQNKSPCDECKKITPMQRLNNI